MKTKFFNMAQKMSMKADYKFKLGAVIVNKKGVPIGFGHNQPRRTHPKSNAPYRTIHAELDAILDCSRDELKNSEIYVYRQLKNGTLGSSKPCQYCMELLKLAKISKVHYTTEAGFQSEEIY